MLASSAQFLLFLLGSDGEVQSGVEHTQRRKPQLQLVEEAQERLHVQQRRRFAGGEHNSSISAAWLALLVRLCWSRVALLDSVFARKSLVSQVAGSLTGDELVHKLHWLVS
mgnify:CR=1 FL=1